MCMPPVVRIRKVGVRVGQWLMPMCVAVLNAGLARNFMRMLVVLIVNVDVLVLHRLMSMLVLMPLCEVQPQAHAHQQPGHDKLHGHRLA